MMSTLENDTGVLSKIFQSQSTGKILDFFLDHKDLDYSLGEIAEKSHLSIQTVSREVANLSELNLILKHRTIGKTVMYRLNTKLRAITLLSEFALHISQVPTLQEYRGIPVRQIVIEEVEPEQMLNS